MSEHTEVLAEFCNVTGAPPHIAEHYLSAYSWDLNRSIEFYLENPPDERAHATADQQAEVVHLEDDDVVEDEGGRSYPTPPPLVAVGRAPAPHSAGIIYEDASAFGGDEDEELQRVLAQSMHDMRPGGASGSSGAGPHRTQATAMYEDDEDLKDAVEDLAIMARQRQAALAAAREAQATMDEMMHQANELMGGGRGRASGARRGAMDEDDEDGDVEMPSMYPGMSMRMPGRVLPPSLRRNAARTAAAPAPPRPQPQALPDGMELPEGMSAHEIEEARMMEAAMLGIPYEGRMPDYSERAPMPHIPVDPMVRQQRDLRWEQDRDYEESLAADRAKLEAAQRVQRQAEEDARLQREVEEAELQRQASEQRRLHHSLSQKQMALPDEPGTSDPDGITIMVRMPDGARKSRRFRKTDPLQALFDHIDVQQQGASFKPGSYNLVTQFPRKTYSDEAFKGSFADAGITTDSAFFLEMRRGDAQ